MIISYHSSAHIEPFYDWRLASSNELAPPASFIFIREYLPLGGVSWTLGGNLRTGVLWNLIGILYHIGRSYSIGCIFNWIDWDIGILFIDYFFVAIKNCEEVDVRVYTWFLGIVSIVVYLFFIKNRKENTISIRFVFFFPPQFVRKVKYLLFCKYKKYFLERRMNVKWTLWKAKKMLTMNLFLSPFDLTVPDV